MGTLGHPDQQVNNATDLGLGAFVCERSSRVLYWILGVVFGAIGLLLVPGAIALAFAKPPELAGASVMLAFSVLFLALAYLCVRQARTTYRFYEQGVAHFIGRKPRTVIPWVEASELTYRVVKQYVHGIPMGANVTFTLKAEDKRKVSFTNNHKTKVKARKLFGPKEVVAVDELDYVRDMVAEIIADRMADRLLAGESIQWCSAGTLSDQGLTPRRGKYKGERVPYTDIDRESAKEGSFFLYRAGDERSFLTVAMAAPNFWPGVVLLHRMIGASQPEGADEVIVEEGSGS
ncbi:MAG TPA: DUF6585 family protein [Phycisphaerales bacterium]|nr:DUF6585 family protein [Phycisphaerales bacterium]